MTPPAVPDVVVPTWRGEHLAACLAALAADPSPHRTVVVDNGSGVGVRVAAGFPGVEVVTLPENVGFGRAANAGAATGAGPVVLVNDDCVVRPGFVAAITAPLADAAVGMVAGLTLRADDPTVVDGFGVALDAALGAHNRLTGRRPGDRPERLAVPCGAAAAYRRSAWEDAGGLDPALFAYGEDVDLGLRMRAAGWAVAEAPDALAVHVGGATAGVDPAWQRGLAGTARGFLLRRWCPVRRLPQALVVDLLVVGYGLVRHRTTTPLTARVAGWRAGGPRRPLPPDVLDPAMGLRESVRRLRPGGTRRTHAYRRS